MQNMRKYRIETLSSSPPVEGVIAGGETVLIPGSSTEGSVYEEQCGSCKGWFETRGITGTTGAIARMAYGCPLCGAKL